MWSCGTHFALPVEKEPVEIEKVSSTTNLKSKSLKETHPCRNSYLKWEIPVKSTKGRQSAAFLLKPNSNRPEFVTMNRVTRHLAILLIAYSNDFLS